MKKVVLLLIVFSMFMTISSFAAEPYGSIFTESKEELASGAGRATIEIDETEKAAKITVNSNDPWMCLNTEKSSHGEGAVNIDADKYKFLRVEYKVDISAIASPAESYVMEFYYAKLPAGWAAERQKQITLITDNVWHTEIIDMTTANWAGNIDKFRFDPVDTGKKADAGAVVYLKSMLFFETKADAENYGKAPATEPNSEPDTNPATSDATVLMGTALIAIIAASVLIRKKHSYSI